MPLLYTELQRLCLRSYIYSIERLPPLRLFLSITLHPHLFVELLQHNASRNALADKTQTAQPTIKHKKRIHRNTHSILNHPTASHNTHTRRQTPCNKHNIDWDPCDSWQV